MRNIVIAGSALSLLAMSAIASAQASAGSLPDITPYNVSLRVGGVFAVNGPLRDQQKLWFGAGLEYQFSHELIPGSPTYFSADVAAQSGAGGHGTFFPLCLNQRFYFSQTARGSRGYFFAGAGVVIMDVTSTQTTGAFRTGLGYEITPNAFVETSLLVTGQVDGVQATSIGAFIGYRF